jgi:hypothetical protein
MINRGSSTASEVPRPSELDQISPFTTMSDRRAAG